MMDSARRVMTGGSQGESLVPPYTCGTPLSLSLFRSAGLVVHETHFEPSFI